MVVVMMRSNEKRQKTILEALLPTFNRRLSVSALSFSFLNYFPLFLLFVL